MCSACRGDDWSVANGASFAVSSPKLAPIFALQTLQKRKIYRTQMGGGIFCKWLILWGRVGVLTRKVLRKWLYDFVSQSWRFGGIARDGAGRKIQDRKAAALKPRATQRRGDGEGVETRVHESFVDRENRRPPQDDKSRLGCAMRGARACDADGARGEHDASHWRSTRAGWQRIISTARRIKSAGPRTCATQPSCTMLEHRRRAFMRPMCCTLLERIPCALMTRVHALLERVPRHWKLVPATSRGWDDPVASARKPAERAAVWSAQSIRKQRREERLPVERETLPGGAERFPDEVLVTRDAIVEVYRSARVDGR